MLKADWKSYFPHDNPRQQQVDAIEFIIKEFESGKKTVIAELGTGVGKSAIAIAIAGYFRGCDPLNSRAYILTSQKTLQDQYKKEYDHLITDLRSANNFQCESGIGQTCAETMRIKRLMGDSAKFINCNNTSCPYEDNKKAFKKSNIGITNYSYFISEGVYAGGLENRDLLILDECHNIESEVRRWATINITEKFANKELNIKFPDYTNDLDIFNWIEKEYSEVLKDHIKSIELKILEKLSKKRRKSTNTPPAGILELAQKNEFLDKHLCQVNRYLNEVNVEKNEYIIDKSDKQDGKSFELKPFNIAKTAQETLYNRGDKKLLLSATILDKQIFQRSISIKNDSTSYISIPTPFKSEAFGINYIPIGKMNKNRSPQTVTNVINAIQKILQKHPNEKGIIHTTTYEITRELKKLNNKRLLIQESSKDRTNILQRHSSDALPTVLVSPSMQEGLDLKDDLGRFQIICKIPFPFLGDPLIEKKMKADPKWYSWITIRTLIQACGRCVRNENDWASTYILDECFSDLLLKYDYMFPKHFEGMKILNQI